MTFLRCGDIRFSMAWSCRSVGVWANDFEGKTRAIVSDRTRNKFFIVLNGGSDDEKIAAFNSSR